MKKPKIAVREYRHSTTHPWVLDLRAYGGKRQFYKTRAMADAEALRQRTLLERHSRAAIGLSQRELSEIISAKHDLAKFGKSITDAARFMVDHLEKIRRCKVTVSQLADEVVDAKRRDGMSAAYLSDLRKRFTHFSRDFGKLPISGITVEEIDNWLRDLKLSPKSRANYRANIGVLFSYAVNRRMLDSNPVAFTA